ncbi:uncharacterized protein [Halyomorpha halys]|uniref:uncharacterized protein n=1 Tax=Halyomorpha halys TaxID=286706 RepID=UPI0034D25A15
MTADRNFRGKTVKRKHGEIRVTNSFKYLGDIICSNGFERKGMEERLVKMERLSFETSSLYCKKALSIRAKIRHYDAVVKQVILDGMEWYGMETVSLPSLRKLWGTERKILRRIYGSVKLPEGYRLRPIRELYREVDDLETDIRLKRLRFYGHMVRMNPSKINKEIFVKMWYIRGRG